MYMMWFDDNPKRPVADKIAEGAAAYQRYFKHPCNLVLVNEADTQASAPDGVTVRSAGYVRPNNFWFGYEAVLQ